MEDLSPDRMGRFKIDQHGDIVDITHLSLPKLRELLAYYQRKRARARTRDIKIAIDHCVSQIQEYITDGVVEDRADIFYLARTMGVVNVHSFIKTYFGRLKTEDEEKRDIAAQAWEEVYDHYGSRRVVYHGSDLPPDKTTKKIFQLIVHNPLAFSNAQEAADLFSDSYGIPRPKVIMQPDADSETQLSYDFRTETIHLYPAKIEGELSLLEGTMKGLFEHLCKCKSWKLDSNPKKSFALQRRETQRFMERFADRCAALGLLRRRSDS